MVFFNIFMLFNTVKTVRKRPKIENYQEIFLGFFISGQFRKTFIANKYICGGSQVFFYICLLSGFIIRMEMKRNR